VYIDSLSYLSQAIEAALEAAFVPALLLLAAGLVMAAGVTLRARVQRRQRPAAATSGTARQTSLARARGAEA
jgi:hypothetical protein